MTTDSSPAPEGEQPVPDEVWDRFLQDSERDIRASAPKEPSARARLVARRLREEEERAAALSKRRGPFGRRTSASTAWRSGTTDAAERRLLRRKRLRGLAGVLVVVLLLLFLLAPDRTWSFVRGHGWSTGSAGPVPGAPAAPEAARIPADRS